MTTYKVEATVTATPAEGLPVTVQGVGESDHNLQQAFSQAKEAAQDLLESGGITTQGSGGGGSRRETR